MSDSKKKPSAPSGLRPGGRKLWADVIGTYELRPDEVRVLKDACREADLVDALEAQLQGSALLVTGSQGQQVINPLVSEIRQHRGVLSSLLRQLRLPDGNDTPDARSTQARDAANARWSKRGA
ncbi:hypothetical protein IU433_12280 [Nocardia puris]|uniref:hypothetical protein n=1 Tax=Nocardia puris TaxID=208602 RepID=UPI0018933422|nr:hypothetical protein [Nocardia puris]MBF6459814.1 hypothetical protein [Nocardia puris]